MCKAIGLVLFMFEVIFALVREPAVVIALPFIAFFFHLVVLSIHCLRKLERFV